MESFIAAHLGERGEAEGKAGWCGGWGCSVELG